MSEHEIDPQGGRMDKRIERQRSVRKEVWDWVKWLGVTVALALFIRGFIFEPVRVDGPSMQSTLFTNQVIAVSKAHYKLSTPKRGDVVVCHFLGDGANYVKRVGGLPGETVEIRNSVLVVNGQSIEEPYLDLPATQDFGPYFVPADSYFVVGDNRGNSADSRREGIGAIPRSRLVGKAIIIMWPLDNISVIRH